MRVADHDPRAFLGATLGRREPDSGTGRGGDEDGLAGEELGDVGAVHDGLGR